ncbi:MAG TPA: DUF6308 family protein, partial [Polyangiaceae bacterium]
SVNVPPGAAIWIRSASGRETITNLLHEIPVTSSIQSCEVGLLDGADSPVVQLWEVLQKNSSQWPASDGKNEIAEVIAGKLVAAKRPALVPIYDQHVAAALGYSTGGTFWLRWHCEFADGSLAKRVDEVRTEAAAGHSRSSEIASLTDLRFLDIVIWRMRSIEPTAGP